jgi:hypothetical protein
MHARNRPARHRAAAALACAVGLLLASTVGAALYKWTDSNGRVVYSDQPPTGDVKYESVTGAAPPANPNAAKDLANRELELRKRQADRAESAAKADKARADIEKRQEICVQARGRIRQLDSSNPDLLYRYNAKGERVTLDAEQRAKELEGQQKLAKEYC